MTVPSTPGIPPRPELRELLLQALQAIGRAATKVELADWISAQRGLTSADRAQRCPDGRQPLLEWNCAWVLSALKKAGIVAQPGRGLFALADPNAPASPPDRRPLPINADPAYRFYLDPLRGGRCFADRRFEEFVELCERGVPRQTAAAQARLGVELPREINYVSYLVHTCLPPLVQDERIRQRKPLYELSPALRARFQANEAAQALVDRLVRVRYGKQEERLRMSPAAAPQPPAVPELAALFADLQEQVGRVESKLDELLALWSS